MSQQTRRRKRKERLARTCSAIWGLISLPVRLWARAARPRRVLIPGATLPLPGAWIAPNRETGSSSSETTFCWP